MFVRTQKRQKHKELTDVLRTITSPNCCVIPNKINIMNIFQKQWLDEFHQMCYYPPIVYFLLKKQDYLINNLKHRRLLQDENKLLMHNNSNNKNELTSTKKRDAYSNKWNKVRFNMQSIQAKEMNYEVQKAKIQWQIEGVIEGTLGRQTVDCIMDLIDAQKLGKGLFVSASIQGGLYIQVQIDVYQIGNKIFWKSNFILLELD
ncbi:unnamed protein product [Paramecium pentaurelia]|uniref:Uncharacterized protein n=1 Tax=Paramecium pentaurelia TaxID=43138 RepID=A0A8S1UD85_9CILI|nr:unnamed protein product [Paramecium pentaurelia]